MAYHEVNNVINYGDDNVTCASMWLKFFGGLFQCQNPCCMGGKYDDKEGDLN